MKKTVLFLLPVTATIALFFFLRICCHAEEFATNIASDNSITNILESDDSEISTTEESPTSTMLDAIDDDTKISSPNEIVDNIDDEKDLKTTSDLPTVSLDNHYTYADSFSSSDEVHNYSFEVDYSNIDSATVCLVRTEKINASITVSDAYNNVIAKIATDNYTPRVWLDLPTTTDNTEEQIYNISVQARDYKSNTPSGYRFMIGSQSDTEEMMAGIDNAVELDTYYESDKNFTSGNYLPNHFETFYKITNSTSSVLTILLKNDDIRYRVYDSEGNLLRDSNSPDVASNIHRTRNVGNSWRCAEKEDLDNVFNGNGPYYIGLYNTRPTNSNKLINSNYLIAFGNPVMGPGSVKIFPGNSINLNSKQYVESSFVADNSFIPSTAKVTSISYNGAIGSSIQYWRVMPPEDSFWSTSRSYASQIDLRYSHDSSFNTPVTGQWGVAYLASSSSRINQITPYYTIDYYYEYGD
ncbi:MAG: hypothetical protein K5769_01910 [Pseudobutyrivibrio sp.]|nr:hypothetical protein [Pseudobutyrivibrio sp.]